MNDDYDFDDANATVMAKHPSSPPGQGSHGCFEVPIARCGRIPGVALDSQDESWAEYQAQLPFLSLVYAVVTILILASFLLAAFLAYRRGEFRRVVDESVIA